MMNPQKTFLFTSATRACCLPFLLIGLFLFPDISAVAQNTNTTSTEVLLAQAEGLMDVDELEEARKVLVRVVDLAPYDSRPLLLLAEAYSLDGMIKEALPWMARASELSPNDKNISRKLILTTRQAEGTEAAIEAVKKNLEKRPQDLDFLDLLGFFQIEARQWAEAEETYKKLRKMAPKSMKYVERHIETLAHQKKRDELGTTFLELIRSVLNSEQSLEARNLEIVRLRGVLQGILDMSGLAKPTALDEDLDKMLDEALLRKPKQGNKLEGQIVEMNRLGDQYLNESQPRLALSYHLQAAYLSGETDTLFDNAKQLAISHREKAALLYFNAFFDHFIDDKKSVELIDKIVQMKRPGDFSAYFDPEQAEGYRWGEIACQRLAKHAATDTIRYQGKIYAIYYHYQPLPRSRENVIAACKAYRHLLDTEKFPKKIVKQVQALIGSLEKIWPDLKPKTGGDSDEKETGK